MRAALALAAALIAGPAAAADPPKLDVVLSPHATGGADSYRVSVRQNTFEGSGGAGLARSFTFGYSDDAKPAVDGLQGLLAHEMAHTWPALRGEHGDTAWYCEGTAEYYSTVLSRRAGAISTDKLVKTFNDRADAGCRF